jgi:hypothetical protein
MMVDTSKSTEGLNLAPFGGRRANVPIPWLPESLDWSLQRQELPALPLRSACLKQRLVGVWRQARSMRHASPLPESCCGCLQGKPNITERLSKAFQSANMSMARIGPSPSRLAIVPRRHGGACSPWPIENYRSPLHENAISETSLRRFPPLASCLAGWEVSSLR